MLSLAGVVPHLGDLISRGDLISEISSRGVCSSPAGATLLTKLPKPEPEKQQAQRLASSSRRKKKKASEVVAPAAVTILAEQGNELEPGSAAHAYCLATHTLPLRPVWVDGGHFHLGRRAPFTYGSTRVR